MIETQLSHGAFVHGDQTTFKLYAPRADQVFLVIFDSPETSTGKEYPMTIDNTGTWNITRENTGYGTLYGYRLAGTAPGIDPEVIIADPYSQAAVTQNSYRHVAKSLIVDTSYDWEGDQWISIAPRDLIIYEMHVRDMTAHRTSGAKHPGTYLGLVEKAQRGGLRHIKDLGVNAVQILPAQDFANVEVPFRDSNATVFNTWNPYARNHWGYMTSFFFAPESYYASNGKMDPDDWNGGSGKAVNEFKDMVKAFHREGIAVIMDVVYNHVSNYDYHPFKYIDRELYFRLDENGDYSSMSGCGNDTKSENPEVRKLILESLKYWMTAYHVDGYRFDLGYLIDPETRQTIITELRAINPNVIILAEPWGGGYDPDGFSDMGWASFNDQIRNGVKGQNPHDGLGFIFGKWQSKNNQKSLRRYVIGSLRDYGGQYIDVSHSVNYLEAHDDHTLGDFIRIGSGQIAADEIVIDRMKNALIRDEQLSLNKLAALFLFTSQGITFIHEGQEWGRSKVIANTNVPEDRIGKIDHNSYNKDNETNWLNWDEKDLNQNLVDYYRGLIQLRKTFPEFHNAKPEDFDFFKMGNQVAVAYILKGRLAVFLNGEQLVPLEIDLPPGEWEILVDGDVVDLNGRGAISGSVVVLPSRGLVMKKI